MSGCLAALQRAFGAPRYADAAMITPAPAYAGSFPGNPDQISRVRREWRDYMTGCPVIEEAVLIASELSTNAIRHSASRGRYFTIRCTMFREYALIEVTDLGGGGGGGWHPRQHDDGPRHGLDIVEALVGESWGIETSGGARCVWAYVSPEGHGNA